MPSPSTRRLVRRPCRAPINGRTVTAELAGGDGLLTLPALVGDYLAAQGRVSGPDQVSVRKLSAPAWHTARRNLHPYRRHFSYTDRSNGGRERREIPIYVDEARGTLIAARTNRMGRVSLHFAADGSFLRTNGIRRCS